MAVNKEITTSKTKRGMHMRALQKREAKKLNAELSHTYRHLSKAEIQAQYSPERIQSLLERGQQNLKNMRSVPHSIDEL